MKSRYWHIFPYAAGAAALLGTADMFFLKYTSIIPVLKNTWWFAAVLIIICAVGVTLGNGGATLSKRIISASFFGILAAILYTALTAFWIMGGDFVIRDIIVSAAWRLFIFTVLSAVTVVVTELRLPDPTFSKI